LPSRELRPVIGEDHFEIAHAAIFRVFHPIPIIEAISGLGKLSGRTSAA
jgi:hypothetical protein